MFGSTILEVGIGLIFLYLILSLICSAAKELIESLIRRRSKDLEEGLRVLLADPDGKLTKKIYGHPLVNALFKGRYEPERRGAKGRTRQKNLPSYIPTRSFALALMDIVFPEQPGSSEALDRIERIENAEVRAALKALAKETEGDLQALRRNIEARFDSAMDRVSGWYKRWSQRVILVIGLIVTVIGIDVRRGCPGAPGKQRLRNPVGTAGGWGGRSAPCGRDAQANESTASGWRGRSARGPYAGMWIWYKRASLPAMTPS